MHTVLVLAGGMLLLAACVLLGRGAGLSPSAGAIIFIPLWFVLAALNMWVGVTRAGYAVAQAFPVFLFVFSLPAVIALVIWWRLTKPPADAGR